MLFIDNIELLNHDSITQLTQSSVRIVGGTAQSVVELKKTFPEQINILPLKERSSDIPLLITYFLNEAKILHGSSIKEISPQASDILSSYSWPGNVLELKAVIERLVLVTKSHVVEPRDLPVNILINSSVVFSLPLEDAYSDFENDFIASVMQYNSNDKEKSSRMLRVSPQVLEAKL
jgi:transcriptional regulator with PAS, ATPase and Fis domain